MRLWKTRGLLPAFLLFSLLIEPKAVSSQQFNQEMLRKIHLQNLQERIRINPELYQKVLNDPSLRTRLRSDSWRVNGGEESRITNSAEPESEVHAAINPTNQSNIVTSAIQWSTNEIIPGVELPDLKVPIYYTKDFGVTWNQSSFDISAEIEPLTIIAGGGDPIVVFDKDGTAYFSWLTLTLNILAAETGIKLHWARSEDGGATWQEMEDGIDEGTIEGDLTDPETLSGRFVDKQWMASDPDNGNVYTAYVEIVGEEEDSIRYNILVKTKQPAQDNFGPAVIVNPAQITFAQFSSVDVDPQGNVHVLFAGGRSTDSVLSIYHAVSTDQGQSFSDPLPISQVHLPCFPPGFASSCDVVGVDSARMYPSAHVRADRSGGSNGSNVYAVWAGDGFGSQDTPGMDIYYSRSTDGGQSWSTPIILNNDENRNLHQFHPSLHVNEQGVVIVSWYDRREDNGNVATKYYMTYSLDGGETFIDDFPVSAEAADFSVIGSVNENFGIGEYTQVIATDEYAIPFWADGRTNDGNIDIYSAKISLDPDNVTSVQEFSIVKPGLAINKLFPNPAGEQSKLELELRERTTVEVNITNLEGKTLSNLFKRELAAGRHTFGLKLFAMKPGVYLVNINSEIGTATRKLVVVE